MTHRLATFKRLPDRLCVGGGGTMPWASIRPDGKAIEPKYMAFADPLNPPKGRRMDGPVG